MKQATPSLTLSRFRLDAIILDMDGVVTRTAVVHAAAWKALFDAFRKDSEGTWSPFDPDSDYARYVDGKPRLEGVRSFLQSRGLDLPEGDRKDPPGKGTVHGLGNRKNELFRERMEQDGVRVYEPAVNLVRSLNQRGFATAVVSSSKNCKAVLDAAGLAEYFDVRVDGLDAEELGLKGKPNPDIFLEAAKRLKVRPERAMVLEDALAGVEAGRRGGFGRVIGVDRTGRASDLSKAGADHVVTALSELLPAAQPVQGLPSALHALGEMSERVAGESPVVFLDYDGTLTPIVKDPKQAMPAEDMRRALRKLTEICTVGIVSGRDLQDVKNLVGLENIVYAGSHGFDIEGPEQGSMTVKKGEDYLDDLNNAQASIEGELASLRGVFVERKTYSIAVHYRNAREEDVPLVKEVVDRVQSNHSRLKKGTGKKVFEIQPDLDWNKGRALLRILQALELEGPEHLPLYVGDDVTDEYAFGALRTRFHGGMTIVVTEEDRFTEAEYVLKDPEEVRIFLESLTSLIQGRNAQRRSE